MGWQARLPKDQKECFEKSCPKCGGTGFRGSWISMNGISSDPIPRKCSCTLRAEELARKALEALEARKNENVEKWAEKLADDVKETTD